MSARLTGVLVMTVFAILAASCVRGVTRTTSYRAPDGSLVYVGEAYNNGAADLDNARIEGTFYDAAGNVTGTQIGLACRVMARNTASAFELRLPPGTPDPARVDWKLLGDDVPSVYLADGLTAEIHTTLVGTDGTTVFGELRNTSANTYHNGHLCIGWKDGAGNVVRVGRSETATIRLASGQAVPFAVSAELPPGPLDPFFYLDAGVTPSGNPPPQVIDLATGAFQHSMTFGAFPLNGTYLTLGIGEIKNSTSSILAPQIAAVTRDSSGRVLSASKRDNLCEVVAPPGGFTIGNWSVDHAASTSPAPSLSIEAYKVPSGEVVILPTTSVTKSAAGLGVKVSGKVKNTSTKTLEIVNFCGIAYNAAGNVIGALGDLLFPDGGLAPGASASFSIEVPAIGVVTTVKAIADGIPEQ